MRNPPSLALASLLANLIAGMLSGQAAGQDDASAAIAKGSDFVQAQGKQWIEKRGCVSCHQIPSMVWSLEVAQLADAEPDAEELKKLERWATEVVNFVKPEQKAEVDAAEVMASNIDTMAHLLLAIPKHDSQLWREKFAAKLAEEQTQDGSWKPCGQLPLQRRPKDETAAVTTLWVSYALVRENAEFDQAAALEFADRIEMPESTEWFAARILIEHSQGKGETAALARRLAERQNEDGGWGWKLGEPSDALGTGYALYALATAAQEPDARQAARRYLLSTQQDNGRWEVPSTKLPSRKAVSTSNDWGTAWAVVALASSRDSK